MNQSFLFFLISTLIVVFSVVLLNIGVNINSDNYWKILNCLKFSDEYEDIKENNIILEEDSEEDKKRKEREIKSAKTSRDSCYRKKAMYGLEHSAFAINIVSGVICSILGLLHFLEEEKSKTFITKTGLIGLIFGGIGFIITFIYIIYSALVFTSSPSDAYKTDDKGAFAKWDNSINKYVCNFYGENDKNEVYAKFNELGKKQYNYIKEIYIGFEYVDDSEFNRCKINLDEHEYCKDNKDFTLSITHTCDNLYVSPVITTFKNKDTYDRWLTSIILSVFLILLNAGLAFFGFTLFKNRETQIEEVKVM